VTTPYTEYIRIIADAYFRKWALNGEHLESLGFRALWVLADTLGRSCRDAFARFVDPEPAVTDDGAEKFLRAFGIRTEHHLRRHGPVPERGHRPVREVRYSSRSPSFRAVRAACVRSRAPIFIRIVLT
jgi:hypothetical protein